MFIVSSIILFIFDKFSHPALPAYIIAGIVVGNFFPASEMINFVQIGLSFLVFIFGVKMDPSRLKSVAEDGLKTAIIEIATLSILTFLIASSLGFAPVEILVLVLVTSLSSTLIGLNLLEKEIDLRLAHGRLAESIHLGQDVIAVIWLMILSASSITLFNISQSLLYGFGLMAFALLFRKYIIDLLASLTDGSRELMMLVSLSVLGGFVFITESVGLSIAIGSFAAGLAVSKYPHNMEILETTGSLKDFFSAIFFVSLGALLTSPTLEVIGLSMIMILLTVIVKPFTVITSLVGLGQNKRTAYLTAFSIDQVSEFALIIAIQTYLAGLISDVVFQSVIITATVSMMISSYTTKHGSTMYKILGPLDHIVDFPHRVSEEVSKHDLEDHIIVVGYDTQGKRLVETLKDEGAEFVVIENNPEKITELQEREENFVYGDIMEDQTWHDTNYKEASLIVSTVPLVEASQRVLELDTESDKILRSKEIDEAQRLMDEGALYVQVPKVLSSEILIEHIEGLMENNLYREDLRRKSMLEIRKYIQEKEG